MAKLPHLPAWLTLFGLALFVAHPPGAWAADGGQAPPAASDGSADEASDGGDSRDTGPGRLPLPRFASIGAPKVNVRRGPGRIYPVDWVYVRRGLPVEIVAEFEFWRKIRDQDGTTGWVHKSMLNGTRTAIVTGKLQNFYRRPDPDSATVMTADPGVIGKVLACKADWCRVDLGDGKGWVNRGALWGVYPREEFD